MAVDILLACLVVSWPLVAFAVVMFWHRQGVQRQHNRKLGAENARLRSENTALRSENSLLLKLKKLDESANGTTDDDRDT